MQDDKLINQIYESHRVKTTELFDFNQPYPEHTVMDARFWEVSDYPRKAKIGVQKSRITGRRHNPKPVTLAETGVKIKP